MKLFKFKPVEDKEIRVKPEISIGQVITIALVLFGAIGVAYSTISDVKNLKVIIQEKASRDLVEQVANDVTSIKADVRTLNSLILQHLQIDRKMAFNQAKMDSLKAVEKRIEKELVRK